ncbi:MAG: HD domain-containing protein [Micromonosporaceae bacterium]
MADLVTAAKRLSERTLVGPSLVRRWRHVRGVGRRAAELCSAVAGDDGGILVAAAWLHDIGYSPLAAKTGLHALDGARYLEREGWPGRVVALVAHHTCARYEAEERGLGGALAAYPCENSPVMDALVSADLTTSPDGQLVSAENRIVEILERYPDDHPVHTAITKAQDVLLDHVRRTEERLFAGPTPSCSGE